MKEEIKKDITTPFLPKTKGELVKSPKEPGVWENNPELLKDLPKDFVIKGKVTTDVLTAIPTIWARPLLFADALFEEEHPLHNEVLGEWKGLLGLFCFKEYYKFDIFAQDFEISKKSNQRFERVLYTLLPNDYWNRIHLIYIDGELVGGTTPASIFFTAAEYESLSSIPWQGENGRLTDPVEYFESKGMTRELAILKRWIEDAKETLAQKEIPGDAGGKIKEALLRILGSWVAAISTSIKIEKAFEYKDAVVKEVPYNLLSSIAPVTGVIESDFLLDMKKKGEFEGTPPIVVTEEGWKDKMASVYGVFRTANVPYPKGESGGKLFPGKIDYPWIRPDLYFFTDKIIKVAGLQKDNVLFLHETGYIPPLKESILKYFATDDLEKEKMIEYRECKRGVEVILKLPLKSKPEERYRRYSTIRRTYEEKGDIITPETPPDLVLWPNFRAENWNRYYFIQRPKKGDEKYEVFPTGSIFERTEGYFTELEKYPEGIKCNYKTEPVGLILLSQPSMMEEKGEKWFVSIDFGTSNTSVAYKEKEDADPKPFPFKNHYTLVSMRARPPLRNYLYKEFLPFPDPDSGDSLLQLVRRGKGYDPFFPSNFKIISRKEPKAEPLQDGVIVFSDPTIWQDQIASKETKDSLKWSLDPNERKCISTYINQIVMMVCAEAKCYGVKEIKLFWSYPSAFSDEMKSEMERFWERWQGSKEYGIDIKVAETTTESIAVGKYKAGGKGEPLAAKERPQIICDIGGGTSDIVIWLGEKISTQTSILLAGNILSEYIKKTCERREELIKDIARLLDANETTLRTLFLNHPSTTLNLLLVTEGDKILRGIREVLGSKKEFIRARSIIFFGYSAVFYYIGLLLQNLCRERKITSCDIHLTGNGPKLLSWIGSINRVEETLKDVFIESLKPNIVSPIEINEPTEPKEEVARGLLWDVLYLQTVTLPEPSILLGEDGYKLNGESLPFYEDIFKRKGELKNLQVPDDFHQLERFINIYDQKARKFGLTEMKSHLDKTRVKAKMQTFITDIKSRDPKKVLFQSFFIQEVKTILEEKLIGR